MASIKKSILNEKIEIQVYECLALMKSSTNRNLTAIQNEIRSVCGVTIVDSDPSETLSLYKQKSRLKIKFVSLLPTLRESIKEIVENIRKVDGVYSFQVRKIRKIEDEV
jgi:hypothetical protein